MRLHGPLHLPFCPTCGRPDPITLQAVENHRLDLEWEAGARRRQQAAERQRRRRAGETPEETATRLRREAAAGLARRQGETPEEAVERRRQHAAVDAARRQDPIVRERDAAARRERRAARSPERLVGDRQLHAEEQRQHRGPRTDREYEVDAWDAIYKFHEDSGINRFPAFTKAQCLLREGRPLPEDVTDAMIREIEAEELTPERELEILRRACLGLAEDSGGMELVACGCCGKRGLVHASERDQMYSLMPFDRLGALAADESFITWLRVSIYMYVCKYGWVYV